MKNIFKIIILCLFANLSNAQTNIVDMEGRFYLDVPAGTYLKDMYGNFDKFIGTWKWQNGNEILIFKIEKVTMYLYQVNGVYRDFLIGNYSYTLNNGTSFVINTITQNQNIISPFSNSMRAYGIDLDQSCDFIFEDALITKEGCSAILKFLPNSRSQILLKLLNGESKGYLLPAPIPSSNFSIPNNVILTKQL